MLGELRASSGVKNHWFARARGVVGDGCAGDGAPRLDCGGSEDVREEWAGGDGTAGGTSRCLDGDLDGRGGFGGREGGW